MEYISRKYVKTNKLIGVFMEAIASKKFPDLICSVITKYNKKPTQICWHLLRYHLSWDWLMPVIEKIESIQDFEFDSQARVYYQRDFWDIYIVVHNAFQTETYKTFRMPNKRGEFPSRFEQTYYCVVEFIKWYNSEMKL